MCGRGSTYQLSVSTGLSVISSFPCCTALAKPKYVLTLPLGTVDRGFGQCVFLALVEPFALDDMVHSDPHVKQNWEHASPAAF